MPSDEYAALPLFSPEIKLIIPWRDKKDIPEFCSSLTLAIELLSTKKCIQ